MASYSVASNSAGFYLPLYYTGWYATQSVQTTGTALLTPAGQFRAVPFLVGNKITVTDLLCEVTVIGDVGCFVRMGVYDSSGTAQGPGNLLLDAGTVAGDSIGNKQAHLGTPLVLNPGLYWVGATSQNWSTTAPTLRTCGAAATLPLGMNLGTSAPATNFSNYSQAVGGMTGALVTPFGTPFQASNPPRIFVNVQ